MALMTFYYVLCVHLHTILVVAIIWNYDTQPYVPYTVQHTHYVYIYEEPNV